MSSIIIKAKLENAKTGQVIKFDTPFENACIAVLITDYADERTLCYQGVNHIDKNGFTFFTTHTNDERFYYVAIGY